MSEIDMAANAEMIEDINQGNLHLKEESSNDSAHCAIEKTDENQTIIRSMRNILNKRLERMEIDGQNPRNARLIKKLFSDDTQLTFKQLKLIENTLIRVNNHVHKNGSDSEDHDKMDPMLSVYERS